MGVSGRVRWAVGVMGYLMCRFRIWYMTRALGFHGGVVLGGRVIG